MSPHWGVRALLRGGVSRSRGEGGAQADLERLLHTEGWASAGATGRCRGHREFRTSKEAGEQS